MTTEIALGFLVLAGVVFLLRTAYVGLGEIEDGTEQIRELTDAVRNINPPPPTSKPDPPPPPPPPNIRYGGWRGRAVEDPDWLGDYARRGLRPAASGTPMPEVKPPKQEPTLPPVAVHPPEIVKYIPLEPFKKEE